MLQTFGTELAETELPNDVQSTSSVLLTHTEKKDRAKVCVGDGGRRELTRMAELTSGHSTHWPLNERDRVG